MLFEESEIKCWWEEYMRELYNDDRGDPPEVENEDGWDILSKVEKAIQDLKSGEAPG